MRARSAGRSSGAGPARAAPPRPGTCGAAPPRPASSGTLSREIGDVPTNVGVGTTLWNDVVVVGDQGLLGPDSVTWRVVGHPASVVGGMRSLIIQTLHPLAMAGGADFSDYPPRPLSRPPRTARYIAPPTFGPTEQALEAAPRLRRLHQH